MLAGPVALSLAAALLMPWTSAVAAEEPTSQLKPAAAHPSQAMSKGTVLDLGHGNKPETYIVQLQDPAVPTRSTAADRGDAGAKTSAKSYRADLVDQQDALTAAISRVTGRKAQVTHRYTEAINGIAVKLTRQQAQRVARIDGVAAVQVDFTRKLMTDRGPQWIGAPSIWDGTEVPGGVGTYGEGVIVGILDTGLNPANPSFADSVPQSEGGDGYDHVNPFGAGNYVGVCATDNNAWGCNDKLIGYWNFAGTDTYDDDGHGSHTGSTAAGNQVEATAYSAEGTEHEFSVTSTIRGVAPHANIIGYDVCDGEGCQGTSILAGIEQAIDDGVDVINYSIGSSAASNPWDDPDTIGFLNARADGINVATSAGNDGPGAATLGGPADVPWITSVAATTHDRKYVASVTDLSSAAGAGPADIAGAGLSGATDQAYDLVYAGDAPYNNPTCLSDYDTGTGDPLWTPDLDGKIIVCDRGGNGRVEKGEIVAFNGAEGMILANDQASGSSLNGDAHALPAAHITYDDGVSLKAWMNSVTGEQAALSGSISSIDDANGDIMAAFSSRGPNRATSLISPSVAAPGVDILAAAGTDNEVAWHFISGTSMASPHTAGALALLTAAQPDWSPAEIQSALMTTAERDITDSDGTAAEWFDMGSGRIELRRAARAGVLLDESLADYEGANPAVGGDVRTLNTASMADNECLQSCAWTRTFTGTTNGVGTWDVSVESLSPDLSLSVDNPTVEVTNGGTVEVSVTADIAPGASTSDWLNGTLILNPPPGSDAPMAHLPIAVLPSAGVLPKSIDITTRRDAGSQVAKDLEAVAIEDLQISQSGLVPEQTDSLTIPEDSTNSDPFDGNGTAVTIIDVPADASSLIASLSNPTAPDFDMYVGTGQTPSLATQVAMSASGGSNESLALANPAAGKWWILVQNWEASAPGGSDTVDLLTAVVAGDADNLSARGPQGAVPAATPFDIRTFWDEKAMEPGDTWHGALTLGTAPGSPDDIGVIPVTINRISDDVTKNADKTEAAPGDVITYTVDVAPNVSREDLAYTITDTLPPGANYVEGSATNGATYDDGIVSWTGDLASTFGDEGSYVITTSADDNTCDTPLAGGYFDLASEIGADPDEELIGDTVLFSAFSGGQFGFYGESYEGIEFSDDGMLVYGSDNYVDQDAEPWIPQELPDPAKPNSIAAMLWQDMELRFDANTGAGVTLASTAGADEVFEPGDVGIVEFDNMRFYGDAAGEGGQLDMQAWVSADSNDVVFAYDNVEHGELLGGPGSPVTIGTENATASQATSVVNLDDANPVLSDGLIVCAKYVEAQAPTATFSYQVKVDPTTGEKNLVNKIVHTTSDPGARPVITSHTVAIKGSTPEKNPSAVSLTLNPTNIEVGGTTTASAKVVSGGSTPTGSVEFLVGDSVVATSSLNDSGRATANLSGFATAGTFAVTAKYLGDASTARNTSAPVNLVVAAPGTVVEKVKPRITLAVPKRIKAGKRLSMGVTIQAPKVTPSGEVTVRVKVTGSKTRTVTALLDEYGTAKIDLGKIKLRKGKKGKVKITVQYAGDAAVLPGSAKAKVKVKGSHGKGKR